MSKQRTDPKSSSYRRYRSKNFKIIIKKAHGLIHVLSKSQIIDLILKKISYTLVRNSAIPSYLVLDKISLVIRELIIEA